MLQIGSQKLEPLTFAVRYNGNREKVAGGRSLPISFAGVGTRELEVSLREGNDYQPSEEVSRVWWNEKFIGWFVLESWGQNWDSDRYRVRLSFSEVAPKDGADRLVPLYKWRHDLKALSLGFPETSGAMLEVGREVEKNPPSWKKDILV